MEEIRSRPNIENDIFSYAKTYIQNNSEYSPHVYSSDLKGKPKLPLVLIKYYDDPLYDECMAKEEQKWRVTYLIEIYTEDTSKQVRQEIRKELIKLVNDVFDDYYGFTRKRNRNAPNADENVDRQILRYVAIVDENKTIYRF